MRLQRLVIAKQLISIIINKRANTIESIGSIGQCFLVIVDLCFDLLEGDPSIDRASIILTIDRWPPIIAITRDEEEECGGVCNVRVASPWRPTSIANARLRAWLVLL